MLRFSCPVLFWGLGLLLVLQAATHGPEISEWFSYERTKLDYALGGVGDRRLADSEEWAPLRIHAHVEELRADLSSQPAALRYIEDDLIPSGIRWFSEILQVRPVQGNLAFEQMCGRSWSDGTCYTISSESYSCSSIASIPQAHLKDRRFCTGRGQCQVSKGGDGIKHSDFVLYITAKLDQCPNGVAAFSSACRQDTNDRPIAGFMNLCSLSDRIGEDIALFIHEAMHALGFGSQMFSFFRNDDGTPRTPRGRNGLPPVRGGSYTVGESTVAKVQLKDGTIKHNIVLPRVIEAAREHYGCPELNGMPMEEAGGDGSAFSHWDMREMDTELMSSQLSTFPRVSKITLALFEDSGWYKPVYGNVGGFEFGRGKGCGFLTEACVQEGQSQFPDTFCTAGAEQYCSRRQISEIGCTQNSMGKAYCDKCVHSQDLPSRFQYFVGKPRVGGANPYLGYCPIWTPYAERGGGTSFCMDSPGWTSDSTRVRGESFGIASRCVMSTASSSSWVTAGLAGTCYQTRCQKSSLEIRVGNQWIFCGAESEGKQVAVGSGWRGYVVCPAYQSFCKDRVGEDGAEISCKFPSSPRHGRCVCAPGYLNEDCAVEDTKANRAKFPYALQYRNNEIVFEVGVSAQLETRPTIEGNLDGLHYSVHPALPSGLSISSSDGVLVGSVVEPIQRAPYTVRAKSGQGAATATVFITAVCPSGRSNCGERSQESSTRTTTTEPPKTTVTTTTTVTSRSSTNMPTTTEQPKTTVTTTISTGRPTVKPTTTTRTRTTEPPRTAVTTMRSTGRPTAEPTTTTEARVSSGPKFGGSTSSRLPISPTSTSAGPSTNFSPSNAQIQEESSELPLPVIIGAATAALLIIFAASLLYYCRCKRAATNASARQIQRQRASSRNPPVDQSRMSNSLPEEKWQKLQRLLEFGFDFDSGRTALEQNGWDVNRAVADILGQREIFGQSVYRLSV